MPAYPFRAPTYWAPTYFPPGLFAGVEPPPPVIFDSEFSFWLATRLAVNVYPARLPQKRVSYPYLTYTIVDGDSDLISAGPSGLAWRHYQFDSYAQDYGEAELLAEQLRNTLSGYAGAAGAAMIVNANVHRPASLYDNPPDGSDDGVYRFLAEYMVWFREPSPVRP